MNLIKLVEAGSSTRAQLTNLVGRGAGRLRGWTFAEAGAAISTAFEVAEQNSEYARWSANGEMIYLYNEGDEPRLQVVSIEE